MARAPLLEVRVVIANPGAGAVGALDVVGEVFGQRREARVARGVPSGEAAAVVLGFDPSEARPGIHALALLLEHPMGGSPDSVGNPSILSQRTYLPLVLGPVLAPAVTLEVECGAGGKDSGCVTSMEEEGEVPVRLSSADGEPHSVSVRVLTARGLRPVAPVQAVVPGAGSVSVRVPLARAGASRGSRQAVLLLAETPAAAQSRTAVATAVVEVASHPSLLRKLRPFLLVLGLALVIGAAGVQWRQERRAEEP